MADVTFEIHGLEELQNDVRRLIKEYPSETAAELEKLSNDFKKDVKDKFEPKDHYGKGKRPIAKSWKKTRLTNISGLTVGIEMTNTAPHFHLVEHGHQLIINPERYAALQNGQNVFHGQKRQGGKRRTAKTKGMINAGFVQGKHYCERTRNEWNNGKFQQAVRKHVDKLLKKHDL